MIIIKNRLYVFTFTSNVDVCLHTFKNIILFSLGKISRASVFGIVREATDLTNSGILALVMDFFHSWIFRNVKFAKKIGNQPIFFLHGTICNSHAHIKIESNTLTESGFRKTEPSCSANRAEIVIFERISAYGQADLSLYNLNSRINYNSKNNEFYMFRKSRK